MGKISQCILALSALWLPPATAAPDAHYQVEAQAIIAQAPRLGLNLGEWVSWGAAQLPANVLKNPGFEGIIDRAIVIVKTADALSFSDDTAWTKRPDGFWAGAHYDVRNGMSAGKQGEVFNSKAEGKQGLPEFSVMGEAPALQTGDVVSLTRINDKALPSQWWFADGLLPGQLAVNAQDKAPGSPGLRSLALSPFSGKPVEVLSYLDSISDRAGKLLPINGLWKLRFWLKQNAPGASLNVNFRRLNNSPPFFQDIIQATSNWQRIEREFTAQDRGAPATLALSLKAEGNNGQILLDDVELFAVSKTPSPFRPELLAALKQLQPGYLRDWQGQLGDTFGNRTANSFARRASRYRPGAESTFSYGLDDFLQLAADTGSEPWLIVPPTMGDEELENFGRYLASQIDRFHFKDMQVEFGNENWNAMFRPAGIPNYQAHGEVATRAIRQLLLGANNHPALHPIINGQYVNPWLSAKYLEGVANAHALAIAPYFLFQLNEDDDTLSKLFDQDDFFRETLAATKARGKGLQVYEVNLHTTTGNASIAKRNTAITSAAGGAALTKRLLTALNLGISKQCLYNLAQYDTFIDSPNQRELAKLWGIVRDLGDTRRLRPTGLVMAMLNQALPADIHAVKNLASDDKAITMTAFHTGDDWAVAAVSAKTEAQKMIVHFPKPPGRHWRLLRLDSTSLTANNEDQDNVRITEGQASTEGDAVSFTVPAYGFVVLLPKK